MYNVALTRPDLRKACELATDLVARAEEHGSQEHIAQAVLWLAFANLEAGSFDLAAEGFDRGAALYKAMPKSAISFQQLGLRHPALYIDQAQMFAVSSFNLSFLGCPDRALERMNTAMASLANSRKAPR